MRVFLQRPFIWIVLFVFAAGACLSSSANPETDPLPDKSTPGFVESLNSKDNPKTERTQKEEITSVSESPGMKTPANTRPAERDDTSAVFAINGYMFLKNPIGLLILKINVTNCRT